MSMKFSCVKLRKIRIVKNITQLDLADSIGSSQTIISFLESGKIENPSIGLIAKVCTVMQIDINDVMI